MSDEMRALNNLEVRLNHLYCSSMHVIKLSCTGSQRETTRLERLLGAISAWLATDQTSTLLAVCPFLPVPLMSHL
jgi:hypothetical protein